MKITFADGNYSRVNESAMQQRTGLRGMRRRGMTEEMRARRHEREMRIQEMENKRIEKINKRMERIHGLEIDPDLCPLEQASIRESRENLLDMLADQISRIYKKRAEREAANMELEAREMQAQIEERIREREEQAEEMAARQPDHHHEPEETAQAAERSLLSNLARADINRETIHELARVRAARSMEALQLRHAVDSPNSWGFIITGEGADTRTHQVPSGRENPNDFNNRHLRALETGIARLDEAIMHRVVDMYRRSVQEGEELKSERDEQEENPPGDVNGRGDDIATTRRIPHAR